MGEEGAQVHLLIEYISPNGRRGGYCQQESAWPGKNNLQAYGRAIDQPVLWAYGHL